VLLTALRAAEAQQATKTARIGYLALNRAAGPRFPCTVLVGGRWI